MASVFVDNGDEAEDQPALVLDECRFVRGQDAVLLAGNARVEPSQCIFGPHAAHFHLQGQGHGKTFQTVAQLKHCSLFVVNGPVLRLDDGATCKFLAQQTIFSGEQGASTAAEAHLFWQTASTEPGVLYQGQHNAFYRVNSYWVRSAERAAPDQFTDWKTFREEVEKAKGSDTTSRVLEKNPWESARPLEEKTPRARYRLDPQVVCQWHQETNQVLGAERLSDGEALYTSGELQKISTRPAEVLVHELNQKIVDPTAKVSEGVYHSLAAAVEGAESGDVILIRQNGKVKLDAVKPGRADLSLTLKPYPGFHPVLTLDESTVDEDAALFRLYHGQLKFENLEFLLRPDRGDFASQTIVAMAGNGRCTFKQCVITLESSFKEVRLSAALLEGKGVMKMPTKPEGRATPEVLFRTCFVRGQGCLVSGRAGRSYDLDMNNVLIALDGSLLDADGTLREASMTDAAPRFG